MKKIWFLFLTIAVLSTSCKKKSSDDEGGDDNNNQTFECLVDEINYTNQDQQPEDGDIMTDNTVYSYKPGTNLIDHKNRQGSSYDASSPQPSSFSYTYNYFYTNESKGLLDRIEIVAGGNVVAKILYTINNDLIASRTLVIASQSGNQFYDAWKVSYTYDNNNKVTQVRIEDYDLWNNGQNPTDETGVYTYTGDNVTNVKWYDTSDMNTVKEEFIYEYDQGKRAFDNVKTMTFPVTRVNNVTHTIHHTYGNNPTTEETFTTIQYNNKGFPTNYETQDDRNNPISTQEVSYLNCN